MSDTPPSGSLTVEQYSHKSLLQVPLKEIYILPGMPYAKERDDSFRPLLDCIRRDGILEPLRLALREQGGYYLISGYRRCHAAVIEHIPTVPAFVEQMTLKECYEAMLGSNINQMDMSAQRLEGHRKAVRPMPTAERPESVIGHIKRFFGIGRNRKKGKHPPHGMGR